MTELISWTAGDKTLKTVCSLLTPATLPVLLKLFGSISKLKLLNFKLFPAIWLERMIEFCKDPVCAEFKLFPRGSWT